MEFSESSPEAGGNTIAQASQILMEFSESSPEAGGNTIAKASQILMEFSESSPEAGGNTIAQAIKSTPEEPLRILVWLPPAPVSSPKVTQSVFPTLPMALAEKQYKENNTASTASYRLPHTSMPPTSIWCPFSDARAGTNSNAKTPNFNSGNTADTLPSSATLTAVPAPSISDLNSSNTADTPASSATLTAVPAPAISDLNSSNTVDTPASRVPAPSVSDLNSSNTADTPLSSATPMAVPASSGPSALSRPIFQPFPLPQRPYQELVIPRQDYTIVALRDKRRSLGNGKFPKYLVRLPNHPSHHSSQGSTTPNIEPLLERIGNFSNLHPANVVGSSLKQGTLKLVILGFSTMGNVARDTAFHDVNYVSGGPLCIVDQADFSYAVAYLWYEWMKDLGYVEAWELGLETLSMNNRRPLRDHSHEERWPVLLMEIE